MRLLAALLLASLVGTPSARAQTPANGTTYVVFWRGDLRIIATRAKTQVLLVDASTGAPLAASRYTANLAGNPFTLQSAGDSFEGASGANTLRVRIVTSTASGRQEDKPVVTWTGSLEPALKHPAAVGVVTNAWASYFPAFVPNSVENGAEIGQ